MTITVRIKGGIGNQLFMFAAAKRLAIKNNQSLLLDHVSGFTNDRRYNRKFQLNHFNISCRKIYYNKKFKLLLRVRFVLKKIYSYFQSFKEKNYLKLEKNFFDKRIIDYKVIKNFYLEGYFQSENYFKDVKDQIRQELKIKPPKDYLNKKIYKKIKKNLTSIAIHLRFFNSNNISKNNKTINLSKKYYYDAIKLMKKLYPRAHYFIFSDQPHQVINKINISNKSMTIINHNNGNDLAYADLWLMTKCQHYIIANSTFSWWGAWLSDNKNKTVIAPKTSKNFAHWSDPRILPDEWIKI